MPSLADAEGPRRALIIATARYRDATLQQLRAPGQDASELQDVLADAEVGGFDVVPVLDAPSDHLQRKIVTFCSAAKPNELILVYLSCHGVLDDRGRLYYATTNTERELLSATAIRADWLNEQLEDSPARSQVVILDCCHSGAFAHNAKGGDELALEQRFQGRGRIVMTASRATEYSFEGSQAVGQGATSVFTSAVVKGLRTGEADVDGDGLVSISDLYSYVYDEVRRNESRQTPLLWTYGAEGRLALARSPRGAIIEPSELADHVRLALDSPSPHVREGVIQELAEILAGNDKPAAKRAHLTLEQVASRDVPRVADAARKALADHGGASPVSPPRVASQDIDAAEEPDPPQALTHQPDPSVLVQLPGSGPRRAFPAQTVRTTVMAVVTAVLLLFGVVWIALAFTGTGSSSPAVYAAFGVGALAIAMMTGKSTRKLLRSRRANR